MARHLLETGYQVAILDLEKGEGWEEFLDDRLVFIQCDVRSDDQVRDSIGRIIEIWGKIDILVNGAAVAIYRPIGEPLRSVNEEMEVNFEGAVNMMNAVIPLMLKRGAGKVHNMGSILSQTGQRRMAGYLSSKAALAAYTKALRKELEGTGVFINMFYAPLTLTSLTQGSGMPEDLMADPKGVGMNLARKIERVELEVFSDMTTKIQAFLMRLFPALASSFIDKLS